MREGGRSDAEFGRMTAVRRGGAQPEGVRLRVRVDAIRFANGAVVWQIPRLL